MSLCYLKRYYSGIVPRDYVPSATLELPLVPLPQLLELPTLQQLLLAVVDGVKLSNRLVQALEELSLHIGLRLFQQGLSEGDVGFL